MNVRETEVAKLLLKSRDELLADLVLQVELLVRIPLLDTRVPPNGADVDHAVPELDEGSPLDGDVEVGDVPQAEVDELLVGLLADVLDEAVGGQGLAQLVGRQAVLGEAPVEERDDVDLVGAQLLLLLDEVGAADETDGALLAEAREEGEHLGLDGLGGRLVSLVGPANSPLSFLFLFWGVQGSIGHS